MKRPLALWFLIFWLLFLALGGLYGGIAMLADPSGGILQMSEVLPLLRVPNYILPGLFLLFFMGILPLVLVFGLWTRRKWQWAQALFSRIPYHWAWIASVGLGILLVAWLIVQAFLIGFRWPIQYITAANALLILLFAFLPSVRSYSHLGS